MPKSKKQTTLLSMTRKSLSSSSTEATSSEKNSSKSEDAESMHQDSDTTKDQPNINTKEKMNTPTDEKSDTAKRTRVKMEKPKPKPVTYKEKIVCKYCNLKFISPSWHEKHLRQSHADLLRDEGIVVRNAEPVLVANLIDFPTESETVDIIEAGDSYDYVETTDEYIETFETDNEEKVEVYDREMENVLQQVKLQTEQTNEMRKTLELHKKLLKTKKSKKVSKTKVSPNKSLLREQLKSKLAAQQKLLRMQQQIFEQANKAQNDILRMINDLDQINSDDSENEKEQSENNEMVEISEPFEIQSSTQDDQNVVVVVRSEEGEEEFELIEIDDNAISATAAEPESILPEDTACIEEQDQPVILEVIGDDGNNIHYRIVDDPSENDPLNVGTKQENPVEYPVNEDANVKNLYTPEESKNKSTDLLNNSKRSDKDLNAFIQQAVRNAEPDADNRFKCPLCPELVSNKYSLGPHILRLHSKHKSKICPHCDRAFTCTGDLTR